ncbi:MAG: metalloregulator ArsR/SmtB family transcription factor [Deltaproteobacteria bacterium]|nr:metalloregulator ArsR/SmtB family transcription factor [Deltaproteobacteria bacterium]
METLIYIKAVADITRLRLLSILLSFELSVNEIVTLLEMGQSRISRHLKIMTDAGLLECRRDGTWAFYFAVASGPAREFIDSIKYTFAKEPLFQIDIHRTEQIIQARKLATMRFFNDIASGWDLLKKEILGDFDLNEAILQEMDQCDVAVDMGCGTGELMEKLKSVARNVIGVDSSSKMLEQARKRFSPGNVNFDLRLGELEHLPLKNGEADCAVISMVLHHLSTPEKIISEIRRVLREKGILIIADFDKHEDEGMRKTYGDRWLGFSVEEISGMLKRNGMNIEKIRSFKIRKKLNLNLIKSIMSPSFHSATRGEI